MRSTSEGRRSALPPELDHLSQPALAALFTSLRADALVLERDGALAACATTTFLPVADYWPRGSERALALLQELLEARGLLVALCYSDEDREKLTRRFGAAPLFHPLEQMVFETRSAGWLSTAVSSLSASDYPEMQALVDLTEPGPFGKESPQLGAFVGIREGPRLIAMGGLRLQSDRIAELTAICTHPEAQGRGLAGRIVAALVDRVLSEGRVPFLHVAVPNTRAIALYERLGFRKVRRCTIVRLDRPKGSA